ncbi:hypothetical protein GCM10027568_28060 [Humibacter soli]
MTSHLRTRGLALIGALALFTGLSLGSAVPASAAVTLAPVPGHEPTLSYHLWNDLTHPAANRDGSVKTGPQLGNVVLVDNGTWNDMAGTTFSYQWKTSPDGTSATNVATTSGMADGTHRDYAPSISQIGQYLAVTVTATNTANGDTVGSYTVFTHQKVVGINPNRVMPYPKSGSVGADLAVNGGSVKPGENEAWFTWYGVPDNTPPGAGIGGPSSGATNSYPGNYGSAVHSGQRAGGDGSYANPLTAATANTLEAPYGVEFYIPAFHKYFVTEDSCTECKGDWSGSGSDSADGTLIGQGGDGGPGMIHFDLWIDGGSGSWVNALQCENALTPDPTDPALIVMDPNPDMPVNPNPVYNPNTGECNYFQDNGTDDFASWSEASADLTSTDTVGPYANTETGQCITDPGNSAAVGTLLTMAPCDHSASQNISFVGLLMIMNNLCVDMGNQSGSNNVARAVSLQKCNFDVGQLWEGDGSGLSDVQNSVWALADGSVHNAQNPGTSYLTMTTPANVALAGPGNQTKVTGSTDHLLVATKTESNIGTPGYGNDWTFPANAGDSAHIALQAITDDTHPGDSVEVKGSGANTPRVEIDLSSVSDPDDIVAVLATLDGVGATGQRTPERDGTFDATVLIPKDVPIGDYQLVARGLADVSPAGTVLVDGDVFTQAEPLPQTGGSGSTTLASFPPINQTVPMTGSTDLALYGPDSVTARASVQKLRGATNDLTIVATLTKGDGQVTDYAKTFVIANNAAGTYQVGPYRIYVSTKGNTQIRDIHVVQ